MFKYSADIIEISFYFLYGIDHSLIFIAHHPPASPQWRVETGDWHPWVNRPLHRRCRLCEGAVLSHAALWCRYLQQTDTPCCLNLQTNKHIYRLKICCKASAALLHCCPLGISLWMWRRVTPSIATFYSTKWIGLSKVMRLVFSLWTDSFKLATLRVMRNTAGTYVTSGNRKQPHRNFYNNLKTENV